MKALHGYRARVETLSWRVADGDVHQQTTKKVGDQSEDANQDSDAKDERIVMKSYEPLGGRWL